MIVFPVKIKELFVGKIRNRFRVASGLIGIRGIREQRIQDHPIQHPFRRGESTLHLIVNHAVVCKPVIRRIQLIAPSFLAEYLFVLVDIRIENGVHIYVHQVLKILIIAARHRVHRLIRVSHSVQKCIK